jgi:hypothetical protein
MKAAAWNTVSRWHRHHHRQGRISTCQSEWSDSKSSSHQQVTNRLFKCAHTMGRAAPPLSRILSYWACRTPYWLLANRKGKSNGIVHGPGRLVLANFLNAWRSTYFAHVVFKSLPFIKRVRWISLLSDWSSVCSTHPLTIGWTPNASANGFRYFKIRGVMSLVLMDLAE